MSEANFGCDKGPKRYDDEIHHEQLKLLHQEGTAAGAKPEVHKCPYCSKTYKTQRNFEKHQLVHLQTAPLPKSVELNCTVEEVDDAEVWPESAVFDEACSQFQHLFEEEDEEQEMLMLASIMGMNVNPPATTARVPDNAASKKKNEPKAPIPLCSTCGKGYITLEGYIKHRMSHALADAVANAPSIDEFKEEAQKCLSGVIAKILQSYSNPIGKFEEQLHRCATKMLEEVNSPKASEFLSSLCEGLYACFARGDKFLLPSHHREAYLQGAAVLLSNQQKREELKTILVCALQLDDNDSDIKFFVSTLMRNISNKLLAFIAHWLALGEDSLIVMSSTLYSETKQSLDSTDFKQTLHYTAGANVKSILRCAIVHGASGALTMDAKQLLKLFVVTFWKVGRKDAPDNEFMAWTLCQDRGKFIKINDQAWTFFRELAAIVKPLEHFDGSLHVEEVLEKFASYPKIIFMWEELIKDSLPKQLSFKLLHSLVTCFCNTWRSGIISRRMDELQSSKAADVLGTSGVSFRPKVVKYNK